VSLSTFAVPQITVMAHSFLCLLSIIQKINKQKNNQPRLPTIEKADENEDLEDAVECLEDDTVEVEAEVYLPPVEQEKKMAPTMKPATKKKLVALLQRRCTMSPLTRFLGCLPTRLPGTQP
jgi:hypothetical protein